MTYTFLSQPTPEPNFDIVSSPIKFYQICTMTQNGKYLVRCVFIDQFDDITGTKIHELSKYALQEFLDSLSENIYKTYPMYDFKLINLPSYTDILMARSSLINTYHTHDTFASV